MSAREPLALAVLVSGSGTNLQAIIDAIQSGSLNARISAVISDVPDAYALERASTADIPTHVVNFKAFEKRDEFDAALHTQLESVTADLIVLAGYMRILADRTVNHYAGRMLNVHPSLLPDYPGLHTYRRVLEAGERWHGTTVHFVIPELDAGPALLQYRVEIKRDDTEQTLRKRVQQGEYQIYPQAIAWLAEGRVRYEHDQIIMDDQPLKHPVVMDEVV